MPWYYAGPEAKPVGPISLDELRARRLSGVLSPETYVIEHTGQPNESLTWKRYKDIFPASPGFPPLPPVPSPPAFVPGQPPPPPPPLFPSTSPPPNPSHPPPPPTSLQNPHYYPGQKTNTWCTWGFGLGLPGFFLSFLCGIGGLLAIPAFFLCLVGLIQVHKDRNQAGKGLAIAGLILSVMGLIISFLFVLAWALPIIKAHEETVTEQTSNNSE